MMPFLFLLGSAEAACSMQQVPTSTGTRIVVAGVSEPLSCRVVYLRADGEAPAARAWIDGRRVRRSRVFMHEGDLVVALPELKAGLSATIDVVVAGDRLSVGLGTPPEREIPAETHSTWTVGLDARHPAWSFADPALGSVTVSVATLGPDGHQARVVSPAPAQGHVSLPPGSLSLVLVGATVVGVGSEGVSVTRTADGVRFDAPSGGVARWRVSSAGGEPVIPDLRTFVAGLEWRFRRASLPEPALPPGFALAADLYQRVIDIHAMVGERMHGADVPGTDPRQPRPLNRAWRSGWGSSVERALVEMRLLQQQSVPVTWLLSGVDAEPITLTGYDRMVLAVASDDGDLLLDPSCAVCAPGELSTALAGRPAVGAAEQVPFADGRLERTITLAGAEFTVHVSATGAAALWLRESVYGLAGLAREERLAGALGVVAGRVIRAEGLDEPGAPVTLELRTARSVRPPFEGEPPWIGGWADR